MKVGVGSIEVSDETRKAIRAAKGEKGLASRAEVKELVEATLAEKWESIKNPPQPGADEDGFGGDAPEPADEQLSIDGEEMLNATPATAPPAADDLAVPAPPAPPSSSYGGTF